MKDFSLQEIALLTGGTLVAPVGFPEKKYEQVVTDSRLLFQQGRTIFFAIKGPRNDGHKYIPELIKRGVDAFVVSNPGIICNDAAFILTENTTSALQHLAEGNRDRYKYPVIGITGSNGKTVVKEWLNELLSHEKRIVRSPKSYNSQTGVPLSVLLMDDYYNLAIFEAGISQKGEMEKLAPVIKPDIGILTNIGDAHQENFISKEEKTLEKLKLFTSVKTLIYNTDHPDTGRLVHSFCNRHGIEALNWSLENNEATIKFSTGVIDGTTSVVAKVKGQVHRFEISFSDSSSIENACHCFAAIYALTGNPARILPCFQKLEPIAMRLEIKKGINNCLLINDYYNSDLASLSIALSVLHQQAQKGSQKMQVILSDIKQTGLPKHDLYLQVDKLLNQWRIDELVGIGPEISAHSGLFTAPKTFFPSTTSFLNEFRRQSFRESIVLIKGARDFAFEKISSALQQKTHQTRLEINLNSLVHNLNMFRSLLKPGTKIMAMVKAFSYGSGDVEIARTLQFEHIDYLAVAVADEGMELRQAGILTPIVVMNPEEQSFDNLIDYQLEPNIYSLDLLKQFEKAVIQNAGKKFPIHIKLDTGMNRLGFKSEGEINALISELSGNSNFAVQSVFSHLAASDDSSFDNFTKEQIARFDLWSDKIAKHFPYSISRHLLNSAGIERFPGWQMDMVRLGIGLYGVSATSLPLKNIGSFKSIVSQVKKVYPGETVGYSRKESISSEKEIAIVPVGYADGMDRKLGNRNGAAYVKGHLAPITGNICMDMLMLDVTGLNVQPGDEVEFFGPNISISQLAEWAGTIPYEILTGISQRVKRIYLYE